MHQGRQDDQGGAYVCVCVVTTEQGTLVVKTTERQNEKEAGFVCVCVCVCVCLLQCIKDDKTTKEVRACFVTIEQEP